MKQEHDGHEEDVASKRPSAFSQVLDMTSELLGKISGWAILFMVTLVTINVFTRKLFNWSIPGFYEILGLSGAVFYSFGIVYTAIRGGHIVMDLVVNRLPQRFHRVCEWINRIIMLFFCCLFAYAGASVTLQMLDERTEDIHIPIAPFRLAVVCAFVLLALLIIAGKKIGKGSEE